MATAVARVSWQAATRTATSRGFAFALPLLLLAVVACSARSRPPAEATWEGRTEAFLWWTIEPRQPYPVIHLPTGVVSVYEESAAVIALDRLTAGGVSAEQTVTFVDDVRAHRDADTGLVSDPGPAAGMPTTRYALGALETVDRLDVVDADWQRDLLATVTPLVGQPAGGDPAGRADAVAVMAYLARHGAPAVAEQASRALRGSPAGSTCDLASTDIDAWAASADIALATGGSCTLTAEQARRVLDELDRLADPAGRGNEFDIETLTHVAAAVRLLVGAGDPAGPSRDLTTTLVHNVRAAVTEGRIDPRPVTLAIASDLIAGDQPVHVVPDAERLLDQVLLWGNQLTTFQPSVPLFLHVARSLLILNGSRATRERLAGLVDWAALSAADRLSMASVLDPSHIDTESVSAAIRQPVTSDSDDIWVRLAADAAIARAAAIGSGRPCTPEVDAWATERVQQAEAALRTATAAQPNQALITSTLVRLARSCLGDDWPSAAKLFDQMRARAPDQLRAAIAQASPTDPQLALQNVRAALEVTCMTGDAVPESAAAGVTELLDAAQAGPIQIGIVTGRRLDAPTTYSFLRIRQILATGCNTVHAG